MTRKHFHAKLVAAAALCTIAAVAGPIAAQADEAPARCNVSYYLTAPYDETTSNYDHVVVFEDDCNEAVECKLEGDGGESRTVVLDGKAVHRVTLSADNERPAFDATATCSVAN